MHVFYCRDYAMCLIVNYAFHFYLFYFIFTLYSYFYLFLFYFIFIVLLSLFILFYKPQSSHSYGPRFLFSQKSPVVKDGLASCYHI